MYEGGKPECKRKKKNSETLMRGHTKDQDCAVMRGLCHAYDRKRARVLRRELLVAAGLHLETALKRTCEDEPARALSCSKRSTKVVNKSILHCAPKMCTSLPPTGLKQEIG